MEPIDIKDLLLSCFVPNLNKIEVVINIIKIKTVSPKPLTVSYHLKLHLHLIFE
jgi:hypothetical protein